MNDDDNNDNNNNNNNNNNYIKHKLLYFVFCFSFLSHLYHMIINENEKEKKNKTILSTKSLRSVVPESENEYLYEIVDIHIGNADHDDDDDDDYGDVLDDVVVNDDDDDDDDEDGSDDDGDDGTITTLMNSFRFHLIFLFAAPALFATTVALFAAAAVLSKAAAAADILPLELLCIWITRAKLMAPLCFPLVVVNRTMVLRGMLPWLVRCWLLALPNDDGGDDEVQLWRRAFVLLVVIVVVVAVAVEPLTVSAAAAVAAITIKELVFSPALSVLKSPSSSSSSICSRLTTTEQLTD
ncbi:hypothetical protein GQX74_009892 [Glossina fuscipes]|nr:hypothetical protein GQX74_009892 [Glossina fuscipes]